MERLTKEESFQVKASDEIMLLKESKSIVEKCLEDFLSKLQNDLIPSKNECAELEEQLTILKETDIRVFNLLEEQIDLTIDDTHSLSEYENLLSEHWTRQLSDYKSCLHSFTHLSSDDPRYIDAISEYQSKSIDILAQLSSINSIEELNALKSQTPALFELLQIINNKNLPEDEVDDLLDKICEHFSARVYRGINMGKYYIDNIYMDSADIDKTVPSRDELIEENTKATEQNIDIYENNNAQNEKEQKNSVIVIQSYIAKENVKIFKNNISKMRTLFAHDIISAIAMMPCSSSKQISKLIHKIVLDDSLEKNRDFGEFADAVNSEVLALVRYGYLTQFSFPAREDKNPDLLYCLTDVAIACLNKKKIQDYFREFSKLKPYFAQVPKALLSSSDAEISAYLARNNSLCQFVDYLGATSSWNDAQTYFKAIRSFPAFHVAVKIPDYIASSSAQYILINKQMLGIQDTCDKIIQYIEDNKDISILVTDNIDSNTILGEACSLFEEKFNGSKLSFLTYASDNPELIDSENNSSSDNFAGGSFDSDEDDEILKDGTQDLIEIEDDFFEEFGTIPAKTSKNSSKVNTNALKASTDSSNESEEASLVSAGESLTLEISGIEIPENPKKKDYANLRVLDSKLSHISETKTQRLARDLAQKDEIKDISAGELRSLVDSLLSEPDKSNYFSDTLAKLSALIGSFKLDADVHETYQDDLAMLIQQIRLSINMPFSAPQYTSVTLANTFVDLNEESSRYLLPALLYALFCPENAYDYELYNVQAGSFMERFNNEIEFISPNLKYIYKSLIELITLTPNGRGFEPAMLSTFSSESKRLQKLRKLSADAKNLLITPPVKTRINGINEFMMQFFGSRSDLGDCMSYIAENKIDEHDFVFLCHDDFSDPQKRDELIDTLWKEIRIRNGKKPIKLESMARKKVVEHVSRRVELMDEWLNFTKKDSVSIAPGVSKVRDMLKKYIPEALKDISTEQNKLAQYKLLFSALQRINDALENGEMPSLQKSYAVFLKNKWVDLDSEYNPVFQKCFSQVKELEAWRCVMKHFAEDELDYTDVLAKIEDRSFRYFFDNMGSAKLIEKMNGNTHSLEDWKKKQDNIIRLAEIEKESFQADLELAFAYGRLSENSKENLLRLEQICCEPIWENENFGRYRMLLDLLLDTMNEEGEEIRQKHSQRLESISTNLKGCEMYKSARSMIHDGNYAVAEEYINKLQSGEENLPLIGKISEEKDVFAEFIEQHDELYELCIQRRGNAVRNWAYNHLERKLNKSWTSRQKRSSENLLSYWPSRKGTLEPESIKNLFQELGFDVNKVEIEENSPPGANYLTLVLKANKTERNLLDYQHPISAFGTRMRYINVVCMFGNVQTHEVINIMTSELHFGEPAIILLDGVYMLRNRQELAEEFKSKTSKNHNFLLIDQVLLLYLATLERSERLTALLKCTLPITFYQPFNRDAGSIPDEMFFGRSQELREIMAEDGASLVYGGRQLGKTALLERAQSIIHKPEKQEHAILFSAQESGISSTLEKACSRLKEEGIIDSCEIDSWELLCEELRGKLKNGSVNKLFLLIDESDAFLKESDEKKYVDLIPLIDLKRESRNKFKFVFAGLHNVARTKNATQKNSSFAQLGTPLCIRPLSAQDAESLLKTPLLYLGFQVDSKQLALILANTNYYPGILQFFGYTLVNTIAESYQQYYSATKNNPPYSLDDHQLKHIFARKELNDSIKNKIDLTLQQDKHYNILAKIIAYLYYSDEEQGIDNQQGYTVGQIRAVAEEFEFELISSYPDNRICDFLSEMVDMSILWSNVGMTHFRLRRNNFLSVIGDMESIQEYLLDPN